MLSLLALSSVIKEKAEPPHPCTNAISPSLALLARRCATDGFASRPPPPGGAVIHLRRGFFSLLGLFGESHASSFASAFLCLRSLFFALNEGVTFTGLVHSLRLKRLAACRRWRKTKAARPASVLFLEALTLFALSYTNLSRPHFHFLD